MFHHQSPQLSQFLLHPPGSCSSADHMPMLRKWVGDITHIHRNQEKLTLVNLLKKLTQHFLVLGECEKILSRTLAHTTAKITLIKLHAGKTSTKICWRLRLFQSPINYHFLIWLLILSTNKLTCSLPLSSLSFLIFTYIFSSRLSRTRSNGSSTVATVG